MATTSRKAADEELKSLAVDPTDAVITNPNGDIIRLAFQVYNTDVYNGTDGKYKAVSLKPINEVQGSNQVLSHIENFGNLTLTIRNSDRFDYFENGRAFWIDLVPVETTVVVEEQK